MQQKNLISLLLGLLGSQIYTSLILYGTCSSPEAMYPYLTSAILLIILAIPVLPLTNSLHAESKPLKISGIVVIFSAFLLVATLGVYILLYNNIWGIPGFLLGLVISLIVNILMSSTALNLRSLLKSIAVTSGLILIALWLTALQAQKNQSVLYASATIPITINNKHYTKAVTQESNFLLSGLERDFLKSHQEIIQLLLQTRNDPFSCMPYIFRPFIPLKSRRTHFIFSGPVLEDATLPLPNWGQEVIYYQNVQKKWVTYPEGVKVLSKDTVTIHLQSNPIQEGAEYKVWKYTCNPNVTEIWVPEEINFPVAMPSGMTGHSIYWESSHIPTYIVNRTPYEQFSCTKKNNNNSTSH